MRMAPAGRDERRPYLLIEYEWFAEVEGELREEVRAFARRARAFDAEAGFTALHDFDGPPGDAAGPARRLVVRAAGDDGAAPAGEIVAVLSIRDVDELGVGTAVLVVAPEHRSRGIATLLLEKLFAEAGDDWFGTGLTGVRALAEGAHPAADRISARFGFDAVDEIWQLLRMLPGPVVPSRPSDRTVEVSESRTAAELRGGVPVPAPHGSTGSGRTLVERVYRLDSADQGATVTVRHGADETGRPDQLARLRFGAGAALLSDDLLDALVDSALADLREAGARAVLAEVDPRETAVVRVCRRRDFQHDQSNLVYAVPLRR